MGYDDIAPRPNLSIGLLVLEFVSVDHDRLTRIRQQVKILRAGYP